MNRLSLVLLTIVLPSNLAAMKWFRKKSTSQCPLHIAVLTGKPKEVHKLLKKSETDPNELNTSGFTPLQLIARAGMYDLNQYGDIEAIVKELVGHGARIGDTSPEDKRTPVQAAADAGKWWLVKALVQEAKGGDEEMIASCIKQHADTPAELLSWIREQPSDSPATLQRIKALLEQPKELPVIAVAIASAPSSSASSSSAAASSSSSSSSTISSSSLPTSSTSSSSAASTPSAPQELLPVVLAPIAEEPSKQPTTAPIAKTAEPEVLPLPAVSLSNSTNTAEPQTIELQRLPSDRQALTDSAPTLPLVGPCPASPTALSKPQFLQEIAHKYGLAMTGSAAITALFAAIHEYRLYRKQPKELQQKTFLKTLYAKHPLLMPACAIIGATGIGLSVYAAVAARRATTH